MLKIYVLNDDDDISSIIESARSPDRCAHRSRSATKRSASCGRIIQYRLIAFCGVRTRVWPRGHRDLPVAFRCRQVINENRVHLYISFAFSQQF